MNRHVNAIAGRLSLRAPQRRSLEILDRITEIAPPGKEADIAAERDFIYVTTANAAQGGLFDETISHSTKPASGQVAGYDEGEA